MSETDNGGSRIQERCRVLLHRLERHHVDVNAGYPTARSVADLMVLFEPLEVGSTEAPDWLEEAGLDIADIGLVDFNEKQMDYISFVLAVGYCVEAMKLKRNGDREAAWEAIADASYSAGAILDTLGNAEVSATDWDLFEPERDDGLQAALYATLKRAKEARRARPTARQVIGEWLIERPPQVIEVLPDEVKFIDSSPTGQGSANLEALRKRIGRLTKSGR